MPHHQHPTRGGICYTIWACSDTSLSPEVHKLCYILLSVYFLWINNMCLVLRCDMVYFHCLVIWFIPLLAPSVPGKWKWKWSCSVVSDSLRPMDCSPPSSSVHGILQARILEWVAISFSRRSSRPRDQTWVFHTASRLFTLWATREGSMKLHDNVNIFDTT